MDADYTRAYHKLDNLDPRSCLSRTGYVISYANCPLIWSSKLQSIIALSTTEAEYIALSTALRDVIYLLNLVEEFNEHGIKVPNNKAPTVTCRVFEDNVGAIELANDPKLRPRTKHLAVRLHHFRSYVLNKQIEINHVTTTNQIADIFTKPLPLDTFKYLRHLLSGW